MKADRNVSTGRPLLTYGGRHLWEIAAVRDLILILLAAFSVWSIYRLLDIFMPVFLAVLLAYLFNPAITFLQTHWNWPRTLTISLILIGAIGLLAMLSLWLVPLLYEQVMGLASNLPRYVRTLADRFSIDIASVSQPLATLLEHAQNDPRQLLGPMFQTTGRAFTWLAAAIGVATHLTLTIMLIPIYFFFFAWHFNTVLARLNRFLPRRSETRIRSLLHQMDCAVGEFFRGRLLIAVLCGALFSLGWYLSGVPYSLVLGMVTGFLNIIPYASVIGWPLAVLLKYAGDLGAGVSLDWLSVIVWPSVVYLVVQFIEGWVLTPLIQSGQTNLSAVTIILIVFIGGAVAGFWGMLLAIPVAACLKILLQEMVVPQLERWAMQY